MVVYYVDPAAANDLGAGTTSETAWKTLALGAALNAGDQVCLKRDGVWREQLTVPTSGVAIGAYGTGAKPIISGADVLTDWTSEVISPEDFTDGTGAKPVAWWMFEASAAPWAVDASGNGNTSTGASGTVARIAALSQGSYALSLAANALISVPIASMSAGMPFKAATGAFTIGGALALPSAAGAWKQIWEFTDYGAKGWRFLIDDAGKLHPVVYGGAGIQDFASNDALTANGTVYRFALRRDGTTGVVNLFINGVKQTATITVADPAECGAGQIMYWGNGAAVKFDECYAFDVALTDAQIASIASDGLAPAAVTAYYASEASEPNQVFSDDVRLDLAVSKAALAAKHYWFDDPNNRVYLRLTADANPATHTIEASVRDYGIYAVARADVTVANIIADKPMAKGINLVNGARAKVTGCAAYYSAADGIYIDGSTAAADCEVDSCESAYNRDHGIIGLDKCDNLYIHDCEAHHNSLAGGTNYTAGIRHVTDPAKEATHRPVGMIFERNTVYSNGAMPDASEAATEAETGHGIWMDTPGTGCEIRWNTSYSNRKTGVMVEWTGVDGDAKALRNVCYGNETGILFSRRSHGGLCAHNVCVGNGYGIWFGGEWGGSDPVGFDDNVCKNNISVLNTASNLRAIYGAENVTDGSGNIYEYNCLGVEAAGFVEWGIGVTKATYDAWETAYGATTHSVEADPLLDANYRLLKASPCRDVGVAIAGIGQVVRGAAPDIGAYEWRRRGSRSRFGFAARVGV